MARRKRRRRSLSLRALLLLLVLALFYFIFDGLYESPGSGRGKSEGTKAALLKAPVTVAHKEGPKTAVVDEPSEDQLGATTARFERLVAERAFVDARVLAATMSASPHRTEQDLARRFVGRLERAGGDLVEGVRSAIENGELVKAELRLSLLRRAFPNLARRCLTGLHAGRNEALSDKAASRVSNFLRGKLPLVIDEGTTLQAIRSGELILRVKGENGGVRHRGMPMTGQGPLVWRGLLIRAAGTEEAAGMVMRALGALYEREKRPLAAALLRLGPAKVQEILRGCAPRAEGTPR